MSTARSQTPPGLKRILAPTDFSPAAEPALQWATSFSAAFGAELVILNVLDVSLAGIAGLPTEFAAMPAVDELRGRRHRGEFCRQTGDPGQTDVQNIQDYQLCAKRGAETRRPLQRRFGGGGEIGGSQDALQSWRSLGPGGAHSLTSRCALCPSSFLEGPSGRRHIPSAGRGKSPGHPVSPPADTGREPGQ